MCQSDDDVQSDKNSRIGKYVGGWLVGMGKREKVKRLQRQNGLGARRQANNGDWRASACWGLLLLIIMIQSRTKRASSGLMSFFCTACFANGLGSASSSSSSLSRVAGSCFSSKPSSLLRIGGHSLTLRRRNAFDGAVSCSEIVVNCDVKCSQCVSSST